MTDFWQPEFWIAARKIEIRVRRRVSDLLAGGLRTRLKGQGLQFSEHRLYFAGDDIRHIDWKVTARSREPMVKVFEAERDVVVWLVVDVSESMKFGTQTIGAKGERTKWDVALEVTAALAIAAQVERHRVGLVLVSGLGPTGAMEGQVIPPKVLSGGRAQGSLGVATQVLARLQQTTENLQVNSRTQWIPQLTKAQAGRGLVFVVSDFLGAGWERLSLLSQRHQTTALLIEDPRETALPEEGYVEFLDPETGQTVPVDLGSKGWKNWWKQQLEARKLQHEHIQRQVRRSGQGGGWWKFSTAQDPLDRLLEQVGQSR